MLNRAFYTQETMNYICAVSLRGGEGEERKGGGGREVRDHLCAKHDIVCTLHTQHERVILVADLVLPAAKPASGPDVVTPEEGQGISNSCIPLQVWCGVAML